MLGQRRCTESGLGPVSAPTLLPLPTQPVNVYAQPHLPPPHLHQHQQVQQQQHYKRSAQEANLSDDEAKKRRLRTNFTEDQSNLLEEAFQASHYPDQNSKKNMAQSLDIPEDRITVWFQNRRAKWRRKEMREKEKNRYSGGSDLGPQCLPHPHPMDFPQFGGYDGQMDMNGHQHPELPTSMLTHPLDGGGLLGLDPSCSLPQPIPLNPSHSSSPFHLYPPGRLGDSIPSLNNLPPPLQQTSLLQNQITEHEFINSYCPQTNEQLTYTYFPPDI